MSVTVSQLPEAGGPGCVLLHRVDPAGGAVHPQGEVSPQTTDRQQTRQTTDRQLTDN